MIRKASINDLDELLLLIQIAKDTMKKYNKLQWPNNYSSRSQILNTISKEQRYVLIENDLIIATFVLFQEIPKKFIGKPQKLLKNYPISIKKIVMSQKKPVKPILSKITEFANDIAIKKGIKKIYLADYIEYRPCETILKNLGYKIKKEIKVKDITTPNLIYFEKDVN